MNRRVVVPIQAYIDDSGGPGQGDGFVLAGFIAEAQAWLAFSDEWQACLNKAPAISRFKMRDAAGRRGGFAGFSKSARDDKLRALARVINHHADTSIAVAVDLSEFEDTIGKDEGLSPILKEPYFWPYQIMTMAVCWELVDQGQTERFEIVFDEQVRFRPRVKWWYPITRHHMIPEWQAIAPVEPIFRSDDEFLPLQAADLLAWLFRRATTGSAGEFDWIISEFTSVRLSTHAQLWDRERMEWTLEESHRLAAVVTKETLEKHLDLLGLNKRGSALAHWQTRDGPPSLSRKSPSPLPVPATEPEEER
jgi:Protein of unknown function (DUF3800)